MSDHNLVRAWFNIGRGDIKKWEKNKHEIRTWFKKDEESLTKLEEDLLTRINGPTSFNNLLNKIEIAQDRTLKVQKKMGTGINEGERILAAEWVDDEVQAYLKERKTKNKMWWKARRDNKPQETLERLEEEYKTQQKETSNIMGMKIGAWEKKILQSKTDSKIMWNPIKEILGKTKRKMNKCSYLEKTIQGTE